MSFIDFDTIIREAWREYDPSREIIHITDISAKVSTNHVYRIKLRDKNYIVAKLSYFGKFEHFVEDHSIINTLSNNLPSPFEDVLARSLMKGNTLFIHRFQSDVINAWVVFYRPIRIKNKLPKRLSENKIKRLAVEMAHFHQACDTVKTTLPQSSKTMLDDIHELTDLMNGNDGKLHFPIHRKLIRRHIDLFVENWNKLGADKLESIPVFVDWNIGNFSMTDNFRLFSRWDYDWFRMSTRMLDFYFFSRVSSDIGDKTVFTYNPEVMMEERFIIFLKSYHKVFPLTELEIRFLKEAYRFFMLNYVIKYGRFFFHEIFANKLQKEALEIHLPKLEEAFNPEPLLNALNI